MKRLRLCRHTGETSRLTSAATSRKERSPVLPSASANSHRLGTTLAGGDTDGGERPSNTIHYQELTPTPTPSKIKIAE